MTFYERIKRAIVALDSANNSPSTPEHDWIKFQSWLSALRVDRVRMSPFLSALVTALVARYPEVSDPRLFWLTPYVEKFAILPLLTDWTETIGLLPDGSIRNFCTDPESHAGGGYAGLRKLDEGQRREDAGWNFLLAVVRGAHAYPDLQAIVPVRPGYMKTCPVCLGGGLHPQEAGRLCQCNGIGWVLVAQAPASI